jgi:hypothetical protein
LPISSQAGELTAWREVRRLLVLMLFLSFRQIPAGTAITLSSDVD